MQLRYLIGIFLAAALTSRCARSDDPAPGALTDASITAAVKAPLLAESVNDEIDIQQNF